MRRLREDALAAWQAGLAAADPCAAVRRALSAPRHHAWRNAALVVAIGKAAASMMRGAAPAGPALVLLPPYAAAGRLPAQVEVLRGGHPVPTDEGIAASRRIVEAVRRLRAGDRLLVLVSGGASALFEVPLEGVSVPSLIETYELLLGCGAPIGEINVVRRALSAVKGGGLLRAAGAARVLTLAVSDVPGDDPATIASGPTVPAEVDPRAALAVFDRYALRRRIAPDVEAQLQKARRGAGPHSWQAPAEPSPSGDVDDADDDARGGGARFEIVCSAAESVAAARAELHARGYAPAPRALATLAGDAAAAGLEVAEAIAAALEPPAGRTAFAVAGETTVDLGAGAGAGCGGRAQHLAAVVALRLADCGGFACIVAGTDGIDGSSEFAGALVDGRTAARAAAGGAALPDAIERLDTGTALERAGDVIRTGPTGTNVGDLLVAVAASG